MAKQATLTTITSTNNNASTLNTNFSALNTALTNTLSRDGSTPNTMSADFDMNSNDILNIATLNAAEFYLGGYLVANLGFFPSYAGVWLTATAYSAYDLVFVAPNKLYRAKIDHTSGVFATDLAADKWELFGEQAIDQAAVAITGGTVDGTTIGGTTPAAGTFTTATTTGAATVGTTLGVTGTATFSGNVDANGNLLFDGVTNKATVLSDLGAQAQDAVLDDLAGLTLSAGDLLYYDGANLTNLGIGTAGQILQTNSGATAPEWTDNNVTDSFVVAVGDETTAITTGTGKISFRMPYAFTLTDIRANVVTAPTGANIIVDVNESGSTIMTTNKLSIDATERTSTTAATAPGITDSSLADDAEITIDIDQVGSTIAGAGLKVTFIGYRT